MGGSPSRGKLLFLIATLLGTASVTVTAQGLVNTNASLFYYAAPDESWSTFNNLTFKPFFLDDWLASVDAGKRQEAVDICNNNKLCIYDTLAVEDAAVGQATMLQFEENFALAESAADFPPHLEVVGIIEVEVGRTFVLQLDASDPEGSDVTFMLEREVPGASITEQGGLFTWTPVDKSLEAVIFSVSDGNSKTTTQAIVKMCDCLNGGTCLYDQLVAGTNLLRERFGVVMCQCLPGWTGEFCQVDYDACAVNPCFPVVACVDQLPPSLDSTCGPCPAGLEGDGRTCLDIDECDLYREEPASRGGRGCDQTCVNTVYSFHCTCNSGYALQPDGRTCTDINECDPQLGTCDEDATCSNTEGSFTCRCKPGFQGDGLSCLDTDECLLRIDRCPQACIDTAGSFECRCYGGFTQQPDGSCIAETSCLSMSCINADCVRADNVDTCVCLSGYQRTDDPAVCEDIDECTLSTHRCDPRATCTNIEGSYQCDCHAGYTLDTNQRTCSDVNECALNLDACDRSVSECVDTEGSYTCQCLPGYVANATKHCVDIDECEESPCSHKANSVCVNLPGTYSCPCSLGYYQSGSTCLANTAECAPDYCLNGGTCVEADSSPGSVECRCVSNFLGERCETPISNTPIMDIFLTVPPLDDGGLSTLDIILISLGLLVVALATVGLGLGTCYLVRRTHLKGLPRGRALIPPWAHVQVPPRVPGGPASNGGMEAPPSNQGSADGFTEEDEVRMNRLADIMNQAMRGEFSLPYVATGLEAGNVRMGPLGPTSLPPVNAEPGITNNATALYPAGRPDEFLPIYRANMVAPYGYPMGYPASYRRTVFPRGPAERQRDSTLSMTARGETEDVSNHLDMLY